MADSTQRPCLPRRMKSCLKITPPQTPGAPGCSHTRKCVAFCEEGSEQVFTADEWDRTPMEAAHKLSYQDVLELKEIQRSLPRASQTPDPLSRQPHSHILSAVPIGLLPLLSEDQPSSRSSSSTDSSRSPTPPPTPPCSASSSRSISPLSPPPPRRQTIPSNLGPRPVMPPMRPKPHFAFLPLLDTPTPPEEPKTFAEFEAALEEELGLSTPSLTNASLDSPSTRSSSPTLSEEPGYFDIPTNTPPSSPPCDDKDAPNYPPVNSSIAPPSPLSLYPPTTPNQESVTVTFKRRPQTYTQQHGSTRPSHSSSPVRHSQPMGLPDYSTSDSEPEPTTPDPHIPYSFSRHSQPSHMKADYAKADYGSGESSPSHPQWASQLKTPSPILEPFCISMKRRAPAVEAKSGMGMTFLPLNG